MERPSRALRRLPGRKSDEIARYRDFETYVEKKPTSPKKSSPQKKPKSASPARKTRTETDKSPARRARSRSSGRKKPVPNKAEEKKKSPAKTSSKSKSTTKSPPKSSLQRVKESVEKIAKALSPDLEEYTRQSATRFEEVINDIRNKSVTPSTTTTSVISTRKSLRTRANANNVEISQRISEEKVVRNHTGVHKDVKGDAEGKIKLVKSVLIGILISLLTVLTAAAHVLCTRDDCRIAVPRIQKFLNYNIFFDPYIWPAFSAALVLTLILAHFIQGVRTKLPFISLLGIGLAVFGLSSLATCHFYFRKLRLLKFLPFATASLFHSLVLVVVSANINSLLNVKLPSFIYRLSALVSLLSAGWIAAAETTRTVPNIAVYLLTGVLALNAVDSLTFEPLLKRSSPFYLTLLVIRPFIYALIPIFISANNIKLHNALLALVGVFSLVGFLISRHSLFIKGRFLSDPYSYRKLGYADFTEGLWKLVRHPDTLGRLVSELALVVALASNTWVTLVLAGLAITSNLLEVWHLDRDASQSSRKSRHSLIPFVY